MDPVMRQAVDAVHVAALAGQPVRDLGVAAMLGLLVPESLDPIDLVDYLRAVERVEAALAARKVRGIAAVADAYEAAGMTAMEARHEVGAALRLSPVTAGDRTAVAVDLRNRFPRTLALLSRGDISWLQAAHLARGTDDLPDDTARLVEDAVIGRLPRLTAAETKRAVADAVVTVDPQAATERAARRHRDRRIDRVPDRAGVLGWYLPVPVGVEGAAWARTTALAKAVQGARRAAGLDDPGLDALRLDVVVDQILGLDPLPDLPGAGGPTGPGRVDADADVDVDADVAGSHHGAHHGANCGARVPRCSCGGKQTAAVVIDLATLLRLADHPGQVPGYGAVPAELAREMAADRDWVRWTIDPATGDLLDTGADTYRPGDRLARYIRAREQVCGFPGCGTRAERCELDHTREFDRGGRTVRANLGPLCRAHHNAKTHGGWRLDKQPVTGTTTWTSPLGRSYVKESAPLRT